MNNLIPHTRPFFDDREGDAVKELLKSGEINEGKLAATLVDEIAKMINVAGGVPSGTGTMALFFCLKAVGISSWCDEVIVPDIPCKSLEDAVKMAGGNPIICDINLDDFSLDIEHIKAHLNKKTRAIILPHLYGCPADIDAFTGLGLPIIEDCAHAIGALYKGIPVGSFGNFSVFSFEGSKVIAGGEGGAAFAKGLANYSSLKNVRYGTESGFAYHSRLSDLTAAVVLVQLRKLPFIIERRRQIASFYREQLKCLEDKGLIRLPKVFNERDSIYYRFIALCSDESKRLVSFANERGVMIKSVFQGMSVRKKDNINAMSLAMSGVSLPIYPGLTEDEMAEVVKTILMFYERNNC